MIAPQSTPPSPWRRQLVATVLVALACLASGALQCSQPILTRQQQHGKDLYGRMCTVCHGANGEGYKADQATALSHPDFLATTTDEYLRTAITEGRASTTMSAWGFERGGPLKRPDVDAVIAYLRTWQKTPKFALDERPVGGDVGRGSDVFARECVACHGQKGTGGPNVNIGSLPFLQSATNGYLRYAIRNGRAPTAMQAFGAKIGDEGVEDVLALLRNWQSTSVATTRTQVAHPPPIPLGPVPLHPRGPDPADFKMAPATTPADVVKAQLDRGAKMALLDARAPSDYTNEHIAGAVSVPFYEPDPYFSKLPKDAWLVCYCACPHAESGTLAQKLVAAGFKKVTVLDEGLGVWKGRKYGTHTGIEP